MPQPTPRKRRNEDKYLEYNENPKEVGTRTRQAMPKGVARDSLGMEDPKEFFFSPGTEAPDTTRTTRTITTVMRSARSKAGALPSPSTPGIGLDTPAPIRKGRLSAFAGSDDDDLGGVGGDLMDDDDEGLPPHLSSPAPYFQGTSTPRVKLPKRSTLPGASPSVTYDKIPTPKSASRSRISVNLNGVIPDRPDDSFDNNSDMDMTEIHDAMAVESSMLSAQDAEPSPATLARNRRTPAKGTRSGPGKRKSTAVEQDEEEPEDSRENDVDSRLSLARTKSREKFRDPDEDEEEQAEPTAPGQSFAFDGDTGADIDLGDDDQFDGGVEDTYVSPRSRRNKVADERNDEEDVEGDEDDVRLEEEAMADEERSDGDEEEDEEGAEEETRQPAPKRQRTKPKAKATRPRAARSRSPLREKKHTRMSRIGVEQEDAYKGMFVTRSGRTHFPPIRHWMGEKFEYGRGPGMAVIKEVVTLPDDPAQPLSKVGRKGRPRAKSSRARSSTVHEDDEEGRNGEGSDYEGVDFEMNTAGHAINFSTGDEVERRIAFPSTRLDPKEVKGSTFKYQKVFGEDQFTASGVVYLPVGGTKPAKASKDNSYVFYVIAGLVKVVIHTTEVDVARGSMFMVPRGNMYSITNLSDYKEARLFFTQARKIRADENEDEATLQAQRQSRKSQPTAAEPSPAEAEEEEEEEEEEGERGAEGGSETEKDEETPAKTPRPKKKGGAASARGR